MADFAGQPKVLEFWSKQPSGHAMHPFGATKNIAKFLVCLLSMGRQTGFPDRKRLLRAPACAQQAQRKVGQKLLAEFVKTPPEQKSLSWQAMPPRQSWSAFRAWRPRR